MENSKTQRSFKPFSLKVDLAMLLIGMTALAIGLFFNLQADTAVTILLFGIVLCLISLLFTVKDAGLLHDPPADVPAKILKTYQTLRAGLLKDFMADRKAIVPAIVAAMIGIAVTIIAWIPLGYVCFMFIDSMVSLFYYPPVAMGTVHLMEWVVAWTPAIIIVGLLIYVIVSAFRVEYPSAPVGM